MNQNIDPMVSFETSMLPALSTRDLVYMADRYKASQRRATSVKVKRYFVRALLAVIKELRSREVEGARLQYPRDIQWEIMPFIWHDASRKNEMLALRAELEEEDRLKGNPDLRPRSWEVDQED